MLQLLLSVAQDEWHDVAAPARIWLERQAAVAASSSADLSTAAEAATSSAFAATAECLLLRLIDQLPTALRSGDVPARQHAQQLTSAIQASWCFLAGASLSLRCHAHMYSAHHSRVA